MVKKVLITGASGFVGSHLIRHLLGRGYRVAALDSRFKGPVEPGVEVLEGDLLNPASLGGVPREWWGVVHLAAISVPSLIKSSVTLLENVQMSINLMDHLASGRVLLVSSCHVYAPSTDLQHENGTIRPQGPYGLSKHLCEQLAPYYASKLDVRIARPFNHVGPGMRPELMIPSLLKRIADRSPDERAPLRMLGINSVRDFIDVQDIVSGYASILELESPLYTTYNVCTGIPTSIRDIVVESLSIVGKQAEIEFVSGPTSRDDVPFLVGSPHRLQDETNWKPEISRRQSLEGLLKIQSPERK